MRLATLDDGSRDGCLVVVARSGTRCLTSEAPWRTLQGALDDWERAAPSLQHLAEQVEDERRSQPLDTERLRAPLPRAYEWLDGSAFLSHVELVRKARGAELPEQLLTDPLIYQGGSGVLLGPHDDFDLPDPDWGLDLEGEVCVVLGDVRRGTMRDDVAPSLRLLMLANDWSYRNLIADELKKGFGFVTSKPATAFAPFAVTPDELGNGFRDARVHLPLRAFVNGERLGEPNAGEMHFSFAELTEHVCLTRSLSAGTLLGSGTVSNHDPASGATCLAEVRMRQQIEAGTATTPFLKAGDRVRLEMLDPDGWNVFGSIEQRVVAVS